MNAVYALFFALLAVADLALIVGLRWLNQRRTENLRISRALKLALTRDAFAEAMFPRKRLLRRAD